MRALADLCHLDRVPLATSLLRVFRSVTSDLFDWDILLFISLNVVLYFETRVNSSSLIDLKKIELV